MALPWNGPVKTPSLEVVNAAGDSAAGRDRIQPAPDLRRVHAQSAQQHRCRIWWLESEDLGQHLLARDIEPPAVGLRRVLKHFLGRGRHAEAIFSRDVSERRLLRHGAHRQRRSVGARPQAQSTQGLGSGTDAPALPMRAVPKKPTLRDIARKDRLRMTPAAKKVLEDASKPNRRRLYVTGQQVLAQILTLQPPDPAAVLLGAL